MLLAARLTAWKGQRVLIEAARLLKERGLRRRALHAGGRRAGARRLCQRDRRAIRRAASTGSSRASAIATTCRRRCSPRASSPCRRPSPRRSAAARSRRRRWARWWSSPISAPSPETVLAPPQTPAQARTGWRVPPGDAPALAEALKSALTLGATARDAIARRARAHVEANFSLEQMTREDARRLSRRAGEIRRLAAYLMNDAVAQVGHRLPDFGLGVHDDRPVPGDRLAQRLAGDQQEADALFARLDATSSPESNTTSERLPTSSRTSTSSPSTSSSRSAPNGCEAPGNDRRTLENIGESLAVGLDLQRLALARRER